jgi:hypothetical protein
MAVIAVLGGLCALAVVALAIVVGRLSGQLRDIRAELAAIAARPEPAMHAGVPEPSPAVPVATMPAPVAARVETTSDEQVPVITALPEADDDLDVTARRVASVALARPLIKVASLSYGLRRALDDENRFKVRYAMRQEFRRQRKMRRRRRAGRAPSMGWRS